MLASITSPNKNRFSAHVVGAFLLSLGLLSPAAVQAATPSQTTTALSISPARSVAVGTVLTLTASVSAGGKPVSPGLALFCEASASRCTDIHILGQGQLTKGGTASVKLRLGVGEHKVKAEFQRTHANAASASAAQSLTVTGNIATDTSILKSGLNFTGAVASYNKTPATGTVSFLDVTSGGSLLAAVPLNAGNSSVLFATASTPSAANGPSGAAVADFNGDGIPDLAVTNSGSSDTGSVSILLGNGDGTFTTKSTSSVGAEPISVAVGDFNGDGIPDLVTANDLNTLTILLGNGDGTFTLKSTLPLAQDVLSIVLIADFNGDGIPDLAIVTDWIGGVLTILSGNGDGTFTTGSTVNVGGEPEGLAVGDFNGDGIPDLAIVNDSEMAIVLLGDGTETFATSWTGSVGTTFAVAGLAVADMNGDGISDLVIANSDYDGSNSDVTVLLGKGDGKLHRSRPALRLERGSEARTSRGRQASTGARSPSQSCSRRCSRALLATARRSASRCAVAFVAGSCPLPEWRQWRLATDPASAAEPAFAADTLAAPDTPTSSAPSCVPARTPAPLPAGSAPPHKLPVAPLHTVPRCTCLRCPTETRLSQWRTLFVTPGKLPMSVELECGG